MNTWYQYATSIMLSKNLPMGYQICNTNHYWCLVGIPRREDFVYLSYSLGWCHSMSYVYKGGFTRYGCVLHGVYTHMIPETKVFMRNHIGIKTMCDPCYRFSFGIEKWWCQSNTRSISTWYHKLCFRFSMLIPSLVLVLIQMNLNVWTFNLHKCHECQIHVTWLQG